MLMFDGIEVDAHGRTDAGKVRKTNQDQFLLASLRKVVDVHGTSIPASYRHSFDSGARALLLLVADGVGGRPGGEEASSVTLDAVVSYVTNSMRCFYKLDEQIPADLLAELAEVVSKSHAALLARGAEQPEHSGMATTLTLAHVLWPRAYVVQIGDSRCYHQRGGALNQVTRDQTIGQDLVDQGALLPEEAARSPYGHMLLQAIGGEHGVQPVISRVDLERGDALLLCTDGLNKHVPDGGIAAALAGAVRAEDVTRELVAAALGGGGSDNVTVVVSRFR
ncbi:MAG: serine/threonine-protein phosphatase [Gemmatimonadales bacterium]|nr:serine/threonine-protein phosphatase [Gemmatimonadales bacterium]